MANAAVGDIYAVSMLGDLDNQTIISTFAYRLDDLGGLTFTTGQISGMMNTELSLAGSLFGVYRQCVPSNYNHFATWIQRVAPVRVVKEQYVGTGTGTRSAATAANYAAVIERRGDIADRKNISALHLPLSGQAADVTGGSITAGLRAEMDILGAELLVTINPAASPTVFLNPVIYNRTSVPNFSRITRFFSQDTSRVMRRRTVGLGI